MRTGPGLGDQRLLLEQLAQASALAFAEPLARFEQSMADVVELGAPGTCWPL